MSNVTESRPRRKATVLAQGMADKLILLDPDQGTYYTLDHVGRRVWELLDGSRSVPETVAVICQEYGAAPMTVETDIRDLLHELRQDSLLDENP
jgi:Coenzyme PQQ synthesis protein D (PqqD)